MEKEFVPYQQALVLKELGFDEPCFAFYEEDTNKLVTFHTDSYQKVIGHICLDRQVNAPTFSQTFRWFREKYQVSPTIHCMSEQGNSWKYHIPNEGGEKDFLTYEEAELACVVKLIDIVKNK